MKVTISVRLNNMQNQPDFSYERGYVTPTVRAWSWALLILLLLGVYGGALMMNANVQTWAMRLSFVVILAGYLIIAHQTAKKNGWPTTWGMPRGVWWCVVMLFVLNITNTLYAILNTPLYGLHSMESHFDKYVPTIPVFVVPYLGLYVVLFATQGYLAYRLLNRQLRTYLVALTLAMGTALITFILFQTYVDTGGLDQAHYGGIFGRMLEYTNNDYYGGDWYSAFPSMHCGFATIFALTWYRRRKPVWSTLMIILSVMIIIATQVLHEHVLMDALYGVVVGVCAYAVSWFWLEFRPAMARFRDQPEDAEVASTP